MNKRQKPKWFDSLNKLAETNFGISFNIWQEAGYLTEKYRPYFILKENQVVANASVNLMNFTLGDKVWSAIQIGTVMTADLYRKRGLASGLVKKIISDWKDKVDFIYLFANDESASFYPQFGFERVYEFAYSKEINVVSGCSKLRQMDISNPEDLELLKLKYTEGNSYSSFSSIGNFELLMFYCSSFMRNSIYYLAEYDLIIILQNEETKLRCFDVLGRSVVPFDEVVRHIELSFSGMSVLELGFTPIDISEFEATRVEEYDNLFVLQDAPFIDQLENGKYLFPLLSHA